MKLTIVVWLAVVNLLVSADVLSDDNVSKEKREAIMAQPSQDELPPRLEAPYATYQPILNVPQASYFQSTSFNQPPSGAQPAQAPAQAPAYEYNRFAGVIPLQTVESNDLVDNHGPTYNNQGPSYNSQGSLYNSQGPLYKNQGQSFNNQGQSYNNNPGPPYYNNIYGESGAYTEGNSYGNANSYGSFIKYGQPLNIPTHYGSSNGLGQSLNVYNGGNGFENNGGNLDQYSTIKNSQYGNTGSNYENSFFGSPSIDPTKYPSSASLLSKQPAYATGVKGLGHFTQTNQVSIDSNYNLNTQTTALKNSRPIALQPAHLTRKQPSFLTESKNPNFRPSFLLGSQILASTPDYNQPTLTSLGTTNQYIPPTQPIAEQYTAPQALGQLPLTQREYLPQSTPSFMNSYQAPNTPQYGLPETIIYTKSSLFGERYGPTP